MLDFPLLVGFFRVSFSQTIPLIFQTGRGSGVDPQKSCEPRASGVSRRPNIGSARALMRAEKLSEKLSPTGT